MNPSHRWKFVLLTLTCWLAFVVAGPAQTSIPTCTDSCDNATCQAGSSCQLPITVTQSPLGLGVTEPCVVAGTQITWVPPASSGASLAVEFPSSATTLFVGEPLVFSNASGQSAPGGTVSSSASGCYEYAIAYCAGGNACITADPKIVVYSPPQPRPIKKPAK